MPTTASPAPYTRETDSTGWFVGIIVALALLAIAYIIATANSQPVIFTDAATASVRVDLADGSGHGSGVYIGNGFVLTAAHVTDGQTEMKITTDKGQTVDGTVLWGGLKQGGADVGLIYAPGMNAEPAKLSCAKPSVGQEIRIVGNPLESSFLTTWGKIAGTSKTGYETLLGPFAWARLVAMDATIAPGVSGGPVYDAKTGEIVGIVVATMVDQMRGNFPYNFMIPGDVICKMLGRTS